MNEAFSRRDLGDLREPPKRGESRGAFDHRLNVIQFCFDLSLGHLYIVVVLQIQPKSGRCPECLRQSQSGVGRYRGLLIG